MGVLTFVLLTIQRAYLYSYLPAAAVLLDITSDDPHVVRMAADHLLRPERLASLTAEERARLFEILGRLELKVRPRIAQGEPLPLSVCGGVNAPRIDQSWWRLVRTGPYAIDGTAVNHEPPRPVQSSGLSGGMKDTLPIQTLSSLEPGIHRLSVPFHFGMYRGHEGNPVASELLHEEKVTLEQEFEVLPEGQSDPIRLIKDDSLKERIRSCIEPHHFCYEKWGEQQVLRGNLTFWRLPVNVAFEVFARIDGKEHSMGTVAQASQLHTADGMVHMLHLQNHDGLKVTRIDLILRPKPEAARQTPDIIEVWDGEFEYRDVPVGLSP